MSAARLDAAALAVAAAAGDEVVAEVELLVGVLEDGRVAGQALSLVEAHACSRRMCHSVLSDRREL